MTATRAGLVVGLVVGSLSVSAPVFADAFPIILRGKVTMADGSAPGKSVGIERICSDGVGSAPGPITDKQGNFIWRMDVDPFKPRTCFIRATLKDHTSTQVDISGLNGVEKNVTLETIVLQERIASPYTILSGGGISVPGKSKDSWNAAIKAVDAGNAPEAIALLKKAVEDSPKFAHGWHTLGILQENMANREAAREAFQKAAEADPKLFAAYSALTDVCNKLKDWACASKAADDYFKADSKKSFPVTYLYQAVARFGTKDMAGAEAAANEAITKAKAMRGEYVLARIAAEKGDAAAAREHVAKYLKADPAAPDFEQIKNWEQKLGTPEAAASAPEF